ncbi:hypothetical protein A0H81_05500 [Grifola frondosa]|uniref:Uncharacterized protein n=1 Tax=Grifola frondosa TaxID=5627 RepID=A0A1C7MBN0_GRIFR|nr:hypothetical protein A0H81_05500 [Grifola frondosa]
MFFKLKLQRSTGVQPHNVTGHRPRRSANTHRSSYPASAPSPARQLVRRFESARSPASVLGAHKHRTQNTVRTYAQLDAMS